MEHISVDTPSSSAATKKVRILHVDDEEMFTGLLQAYFERHGHGCVEVQSAHSAADGLDLLESEQFDCIVSDFSMSGTNGLQFLQQVRTERPTLPFILFTGQGSEQIASDAISAGVTDYVQKGGTERLELLMNRIKHAIDNRTLSDELEEEARKFRAVWERASDAMVLADDDGRYVDVNPEACRLFGVEKEELLGKTAADFAESGFDFAAAWQQFKASDREHGRFPLRRPDGTSMEVEYSATPDIVPGLSLSILRPASENEGNGV
jgi:PAS domain S-box-containing protein